jgi:hypothetical protein
MSEENEKKRRKWYFFAFLAAWIGGYFVAYYAMGNDDTVAEGIVTGLCLAIFAAVAGMILYWLAALVRWVFERPSGEIKHGITARFSDDGRAVRTAGGELVGKAAKAKVAETIKNNKLTDDMLLILRGVEGRIDVQIQSEVRALRALDRLNAAYAACEDAGISPPDELRKSAADFWGVVEASNSLFRTTIKVCTEIEKTLALQRVMNLPPLPDLYADAIGEDISPLLDAVRTRRENLEAAWNDVEDALRK